jgi:hypothetical protein
VNTVLGALTDYEGATGRKYARRGERATAFATTVEGFIGDLLLARNDIAADGWVFRPLHHRNFTGSDVTRTHMAAAIAGVEFLGLIERAPYVRRFGADLFVSVSGKMQLKGGGARFRSTLKVDCDGARGRSGPWRSCQTLSPAAAQCVVSSGAPQSQGGAE